MNAQQEASQPIKSFLCPGCGDKVDRGEEACNHCGIPLYLDFGALFGVDELNMEGRDERLDAAVMSLIATQAQQNGIKTVAAFKDYIGIYVPDPENEGDLLLVGGFGPDSDGDYEFYLSEQDEPLYVNWSVNMDGSGARVYHIFTLSESIDFHVSGEEELQEALAEEWVESLLEPGIQPESVLSDDTDKNKAVRDRFSVAGAITLLTGLVLTPASAAFDAPWWLLPSGLILIALGAIVIGLGQFVYGRSNQEEL